MYLQMTVTAKTEAAEGLTLAEAKQQIIVLRARLQVASQASD